MRSLQELMSLSGRVALVTGGAGHLGHVICMALAELGASVAVLDRSGSHSVANQLRDQYNVRAWAIEADLADDQTRKLWPQRVVDSLGRLDILINNAALVGDSGLSGWISPFPEQTLDTWRKAIDINLTAVFELCQAALPHLSFSGSGSIVNIASIHGLIGPDWSLYEGTEMGNPAAYAASKGGLIQFTRWLAVTTAPRVRVNAISPGGILRGQPELFLSRYQKRTPLQRLAIEEDFKGAVAFLASDASSYVTGQNITIDGGYTSL